MKALYKLFSLLLIGLIACQTTLDIPLPPHESRLVLNAFLEPEQTLDLYLTRSYGPLEAPSIQEQLISDASVQLSIDGQDVGEFVYQDTAFFPGATGDEVSGKYTNPATVQSGQRIEVVISHPDYETIEAATQIPNPIQIVDARIEQNVVRQIFTDGRGRFQSLFHLTIADPENVANYYVIEADIEYEDPNFPGQPLRATADIEGIARLGEDGVYTGINGLFSDEDFDGQTETVTLLCGLPNAFNEPADVQTLDIKTIYVYAISADEAYARYQLNLAAQQNGFGGITILQT
ncbi:MAG: DUF4249 domain-containing protein, partial [Bacteroidota bacterium]